MSVLWENAIGYGTLAARPAPGAPGALYFASDVQQGYRDNGLSWDILPGGGLPLIDSIELAEDTDSIEFSAIAGTFKALQLDLEARGDYAGTFVNVHLQINGDEGDNYDTQTLDAYGTTAEGGERFAQTEVLVVRIPAATAPDSVAGGARLYLPNYAGTAFEKRIQSHGGAKLSLSEEGMAVWMAQGYWRNTAPVTTITLSPSTGNFVAGSTARLYGLH